jgi:CheY-like chemotaxis protein
LSFAIPTTPAVGAAVSTTASTAVPPLRILIVDDDPLVLKSLCETLEADGHSVTTAEGGQAGIDAFLAARAQNNPFPVVITDLGMPYVDGRKVSGAVKTAAPGTIVLLLTGWGQRLVADGDVPAHVDRVLAKPPKLRDLREALARSLEARTSWLPIRTAKASASVQSAPDARQLRVQVLAHRGGYLDLHGAASLTDLLFRWPLALVLPAVFTATETVPRLSPEMTFVNVAAPRWSADPYTDVPAAIAPVSASG